MTADRPAADDGPTLRRTDYWDASECEGSVHCPPRCPRFVDARGDPWLIVPATDDHVEDLVAMYDDFDPADRAMGLPPLDHERTREWVRTVFDEGSNVVATDGDRIVGHALYTPTDDEEPEFAVFVDGAHQERGIGTELSKHVVAVASAADREALTLLVEPSNRPARRLYERLGFEVVEELSRDGPGSRTDTLRMRLDLSRSVGLAVRRPPVVADD